MYCLVNYKVNSHVTNYHSNQEIEFYQRYESRFLRNKTNKMCIHLQGYREGYLKELAPTIVETW